ncbi:hypothetical protein [Desulfobacter curvatus]|uniref:hypothetical protein n=1 Tax=Desulfobacter curvatus TaxID=2290 RepID=UPI00036D0DED|nr:hypothetical protein [Desulfobacter curvatus]
MAKSTLGLKLEPEIEAEFKKLQAEAGSRNAQEFVETLLSNYVERKEETNTDSPVHKEQVKVRQALSQIDRVVSAYLELAANDKITAETKAQEVISKFENAMATLKSENQELKAKFDAIQAERDELKKQNDALHEKEINVQDLRNAWMEKEKNLTDRISGLEVEVYQTRALKDQVMDLENQIKEKVSVLALADQQAKNDQSVIQDLKQRLEGFQDKVGSLEKDLATARDELMAEKLESLNRIKEVTSQAAEEKGILTGELNTLRQELARQKDV